MFSNDLSNVYAIHSSITKMFQSILNLSFYGG